MTTNERDVQALELRRAGLSVPAIVARLKYRTRQQCEAAIARQIGEQASASTPRAMRDLELDRLDRLHQAAWLLAVKGDLAAMDRVLAIASARLRIAAMNETQGATPMVTAFDATVAALGDSVTDMDRAVVEGGRRIAARIDAAAGSLDPVADTKALYLMPHLMTLLAQLGATPAARAAVKGAASAGEPTPKQSQKDDLATWRAQRGIGT